ncbi:MAG TPA: zinc metallopeptidase [Candidatus Lachnoclostridium stercorigallinarum]|uniref:Zinc metallopeptidase n=1 Tax=Candidatus Lachnoclostridium stercorigallinarum TaxID=2838634 RepID=A0A9D2GH66_9FIRM|nr:zinc metallopeptidase [Candidatus Lachnoclostridium stercorigallinarum]
MGYYGYGYPRYGFGFYWDPTLILVVIGALISMWASGRVQSTFNRYSRVGSRSGMTGAETARRILDSQGLYDVQIRSVRGNLTDHYDPRTRTVNLSQSVYGSTSVASVGVAAHECGHAVQHAQQYAPLNIRSALVPIANIGTNLSWPIIIIGLLLGMSPFLRLGILLFSLGVLFQLVTLPVEFNASSRAVTLLDRLGILQGEEVDGAKKVLKAAALTYVAAAAGTILQLLRMVILFGGRNNRDNN